MERVVYNYMVKKEVDDIVHSRKPSTALNTEGGVESVGRENSFAIHWVILCCGNQVSNIG